MDPERMQPVPVPEERGYSVPWSVLDSWIGVLLLALVNIGLLAIVSQDPSRLLVQSATLIIVQLAYLLPLVLIFTWRRISWRHLGFGRFDRNTLGLGCGLLVASYVVIIIHFITYSFYGFFIDDESIRKF